MKPATKRFTTLTALALTSVLLLGACGNNKKEATLTSSSSKVSQKVKSSKSSSSKEKAKKSEQKTKSSKATCNYKIHLGGSPVSPLVE